MIPVGDFSGYPLKWQPYLTLILPNMTNPGFTVVDMRVA
jgi:hypothetical protein